MMASQTPGVPWSSEIQTGSERCPRLGLGLRFMHKQFTAIYLYSVGCSGETSGPSPERSLFNIEVQQSHPLFTRSLRH